ncbi:glycosyltransferase family 4 protein [Clostridium saudiense]|uniref:glycosyltransferase family 4 protein n=1 Tax=Clostridium saudiense TaxID=1414720 RepID=UPI0026705533|nr:glycosyltransferase family 4 protein [Clostridium saudiense]
MNILMLTHEKNLNGASKSMINLIDNLIDKHKFYIVSSYIDGPVIEELKKRNVVILNWNVNRWMRKIPNSKIKWFMIKFRWFFFDRFYSLYNAIMLKRKIKNFNIDIIHSNVSVINLGGLLSKVTGIPHVWYIREFGQEDFDMYPLLNYDKFYKTMDKQSDAIITVSKALKKKYAKHIKSKKLITIYNGIGNENIISDRVYAEKECYNFLITGTIQEGKGQEVAIKAVEELVKRGVTNLKLYIAGRGDITKLKNIFPSQEKYVVFLGQVNDMIMLRKKMDVELVCSKSEAFGRVTVEAMMGGMLVIGANTGGTPELINNGENGYLYEQGNPIALADIMQHVLNQPEKIKELATNASKQAIVKFSIERCAKEVNEVYNKLT